MRSRAVYFLLLASIVYWTTGTAVFLHDRLEHGEHETVAKSDECNSPSGSGRSGHRHHAHDDCPTCQLLAHMQADHVRPPAFVSLLLPSLCNLHLYDRESPGIVAMTLASIRGPPCAAERLA